MINTKLQVLTLIVFVFAVFVHPVSAATHGPSHSPSPSISFGLNTNFQFGDLLGQFFGHKFDVSLDGSQEVLKGDIDGTGEAKIRIREERGELCVDIETNYIDQARGAHIHHAPKGSNGTMVVNLPIPNEDGEAKGCIEVSPDVLNKITTNAHDYYINIHTNPYPDGAIRGQLE